MIFRSLCRRLVPLAAVALVSIGVALQAQARPESFNWIHPQPASVQDFEAHVRNPDGSNSQIFSIGVPSRGSDGVYRSAVEVGDGDKLISLRAVGPGDVRSDWTSSRLRLDRSGGGSTGGGSGGGTGDVPVGPGTPINPTIGATQRYDFSANPVGSNVAPWVDTAANYSLQTDDSLFEVTDLGGNRVLHTSSTASDIHSHAGGSGTVWTDFEVRGRMAIGHPDASIGVTSYSLYSETDQYYRLGRGPGGPFQIEGRPALSCAPSSNPVVPQAGEWYRFEFDVEDLGSSNRIRAKVWRQGDTEPSGYELSCLDSSSGRPRSGRIGVWSSGTGDKYWDDFEVVLGAGGGAATPPEPPVLLQVVPVAP